MIKLLFLLFIAINIYASDIFNNGRIFIGNFVDNNSSKSMIDADSVDIDTGLLQQPWYDDNGTWYKLTFSSFGLSLGMTFDGEKVFTGGSKSTQEAEYIIPSSVESNASLASGFGILKSKAVFTDFDTPGYTLEVVNNYELKENRSFMKITTTVTNKSGRSISDLNVWVGAQDDYVGKDDRPIKERGNLDLNNSFIEINDTTEQSKALKITSNSEYPSGDGSSIGSTVLFYTADNRAYMTLAAYSLTTFIPLMNQSPQAAAINSTVDGSYGMKVVLGDVADGESETFSWYYIAGSASAIEEIIEETVIDAGVAATDINLSSERVDENLAIGATVGELSSVDLNLDDIHTYSFTCNTVGADDDTFSIAGSLLKIDESADFETKNSYNICIKTTDTDDKTFEKNFLIRVNDLNELPPTDIQLSNNIINENISLGATVGQFSVVDLDVNDNHTFSFTCNSAGADDSDFTIEDTTLKINSVVDYETKELYNICVRTTDSVNNTFDKNFVISVNDTSEQFPTDILLTNTQVTENVSPDTVIGSLTALDLDLNDNHTFSFTCNSPGSDDSDFTISVATLTVNESPDAELKGSYDICIRAIDSSDKTFDKNFVIMVHDISEIVPSGIVLSNSSVDENLAPNTKIGDLTAIDLDLNDHHTFSFTCSRAGTDDSTFSISDATLKIDEQADYETKSAYNICIRTTDSTNYTFDKDFTITVNDRSDTPSINECNADGLIPNIGLFDDCHTDEDADGFTALEGDCDDSKADINPNGVEIPNNGIDEDCSGSDLDSDEDGDGYTPVEGDCNDNNSAINPGATDIPNNGIDEDCSNEDLIDDSLLDHDGDTFTPASGDCNDFNVNIHPGAIEIPNNGIDEDCLNGDEVDESSIDADGDGYSVADGDCNDNNSAINPGVTDIPNNGIDEDCYGGDVIDDSITDNDNDYDGFTVVGGDCDDTDPLVYPGATEIPNNGIDEDCSGGDFIDTGTDGDGSSGGGTGSGTDGDGSSGDGTLIDMDGDGYSVADGDCDDFNAVKYPTATEIANNGIDEDCSGKDLIDPSAIDSDGDGYTPAHGDCNDNNSLIYPTVIEIANNGIDEDCSGEDLINPSVLDGDGDGYTPSGGDCNDNNSAIFPNATEIANNGIDEDCSGDNEASDDTTQNDEDGDGYRPSGGDCNDYDSSINPAAIEVANNGIDEDCSGQDKSDPSTLDTDGDGYTPETGDCNDYNSAVYPNAVEVPDNGIDEDCSGSDLDGVNSYTPVPGVCTLDAFATLQHIQVPSLAPKNVYTDIDFINFGGFNRVTSDIEVANYSLLIDGNSEQSSYQIENIETTDAIGDDSIEVSSQLVLDNSESFKATTSLYHNGLSYIVLHNSMNENKSKLLSYKAGLDIAVKQDSQTSISFLHVNPSATLSAVMRQDGVLESTVSKIGGVSTASTNIKNSEVFVTENSEIQLVSHSDNTQMVAQTDLYARQLHLVSSTEALLNRRKYTIVGSSLDNSTTTIDNSGIVTKSYENGCGVSFNVVAATDTDGKIRTKFEFINPSASNVVSENLTLNQSSSFEAGSTVSMEKVGRCDRVIKILTPLTTEIKFK
ncbi:MAG: MopE-related protein [Campylobacterota bacterium]|nr:MopE-related protein [Campylobacterota bacterium]